MTFFKDSHSSAHITIVHPCYIMLPRCMQIGVWIPRHALRSSTEIRLRTLDGSKQYSRLLVAEPPCNPSLYHALGGSTCCRYCKLYTGIFYSIRSEIHLQFAFCACVLAGCFCKL